MPTDNSSFTTAANTNYSWSVLDQYRILTCSGVDARTFLQGQCTNDMLNLAEQGSFGAHCNVKGRMVSSFYCAPIEDAIYLRVHQDICTTTIAALKKYMVFAKAELKANDDLIVISVHGEHLQSHISQPTISALIKHWHALSDTLAELWIERDKLSALENLLGYKRGDTQLWEQQLINLGLAELRQGQSELFLPQELNFDLIGGVNYKKGCYIGQEVIARLHYRGQLKKHLRRISFELDSPTQPTENTTLYNNAGEKVGIIVQSTPYEQTHQALCLVDDKAFNEHNIYLHNGAQKPEKVLCLSLPYAIPKAEQS